MANRFWVGGTGTWNGTTTTQWSASSGGAGGVSVPTATDNVFFDTNSGGGTVTLSASLPCNNLDTTGWMGVFASTFNILFSGNVNLGSNITNIGLFATGAFTHTFTSNGFTINALGYNGAGSTISLQDDIIVNGTNGIRLNSSGTIAFTTNNHNVTTFAFLQNIAGATTNMGSSIFTLFGTATVWSLSAGTVNSGTSSIVINDSTNTTISFLGGGFTYSNLFFTRGSSTASNTITGSNTFNTFQDTGTAAHSVLFTAGTTQTISTWSVSGTSGNLITLNSTSTATYTLSQASGTVSSDYLNIQHSVATGGASWYAGANSVNNQGVATAGSGWIFTAPPAVTLLTNIVSYWKLDGNSNDSVGTNNGTDTAISYSIANGKIGQGAGFNGSSSKIEIASSSGLNSPNWTANWWANINTVNTFNPTFSKGPGDVSGFLTLSRGTGKYSMTIGSAGGQNELQFSASLSNATYYMFTATYDGTTFKIYLNGAFVTSVAATYTTNASNLEFGTSASLAQFLTGDMDEVGFWSRALTVAEVTKLYNGGLGLSYPFATGNFLSFM